MMKTITASVWRSLIAPVYWAAVLVAALCVLLAFGREEVTNFWKDLS